MSADEHESKKGSMQSNVISVQLDLDDPNLINKITKQSLNKEAVKNKILQNDVNRVKLLKLITNI